VDKAAQ
jgi:hypothetical protein